MLQQRIHPYLPAAFLGLPSCCYFPAFNPSFTIPRHRPFLLPLQNGVKHTSEGRPEVD